MLCVSSIRYSILINGAPMEPIVSMRGLRQGDPLSPYFFFIMCVEGLSMLLQDAERRGSLNGIRIA